MTAQTPPPGVKARSPIEGCAADWEVPGPQRATYLSFRLWPPREPKTNRVGRETSPGHPAKVEIRTGIVNFGPDFTDPTELRRWLWQVLKTGYALAAALEGVDPPELPEPEPDPQTTLDDFVDDVIRVGP